MRAAAEAARERLSSEGARAEVWWPLDEYVAHLEREAQRWMVSAAEAAHRRENAEARERGLMLEVGALQRELVTLGAQLARALTTIERAAVEVV